MKILNLEIRPAVAHRHDRFFLAGSGAETVWSFTGNLRRSSTYSDTTTNSLPHQAVHHRVRSRLILHPAAINAGPARKADQDVVPSFRARAGLRRSRGSGSNPLQLTGLE